jgi:hypothetical protein
MLYSQEVRSEPMTEAIRIEALAILSKELAVPLSKLVSKISQLAERPSEREQAEAIKMLKTMDWARVHQVGGGEEVLSITANGAKEVERISRKGLIAFL